MHFALALALTTLLPESFINYSAKEINVKIVYYGASGAPVLENLQSIYEKTDPDAKGKMISLATETDRTVFFDFLPKSLGTIRGFSVRFHLYTTPTMFFDASRRLVLKGADGVVFVASGDRAKSEETRASWDSLIGVLAELGYDWKTMPIVVQIDRGAQPGALTGQEISKLLALGEQPIVVADARTGTGVLDTMKSIAKQVLLELKKGAEAK